MRISYAAGRAAAHRPRRASTLCVRSRVVDGPTDGAAVTEGTLKGLSSEARSIFKEAQENIVELNKSRLKALEELKLARQKIAELEQKLEVAVVEVHEAASQVADYAASHSKSNQQAPAADPGAAPPRPGASPVPQAGSITLVYETGWDTAFLHYNPDGKGWTIVPGSQMLNGTDEYPDKKVISVVASSLEFVVNDGGSGWDQPGALGGKPGNYVIASPGTYRLRDGKVVKID